MLTLLGLITFFQLTTQQPWLAPIPDSQIVSTSVPAANPERLLAQASLDLSHRWPQAEINQGFTDNILLSLHYLKDSADKNSQDVDWEKVRQDFEISFELAPGEIFAFHKNVLPEYKGKNLKTMGSEFVTNQGYKYIGGLGGNGVCHLASLMNWVASEAGLQVEAPTRHNFATIAGVPKEYWTSIRYQENGGNSQNQNLYIVNNFDFPVEFRFEKKGQELSLKIYNLLRLH